MLDSKDEKMNKMENLAKEVLKLSRNTLLVNLRFLDRALSQFEYISVPESTIITDGRNILFDPKHILACYKTEKERTVRDYLHIVMHCVFRHMYMDPALNRLHWDLSCDISVEYMITELGLKSVSSERERKQARFIEKLKKKIPSITAEKVYAYLKSGNPDPEWVEEARKVFCADDHAIWYMTAEEISQHFGLVTDQENGASGENESAQGIGVQRMMESVWKGISERMQIDMETFGKRQGLSAGSMLQNLAAVNREKYDYTAFLKKFAVIGETMRINDDEYDYIFYTYGLKLYEKMPLIEPLEYKEVKAIKEFVIAIDTSGSTSGELVQKFVQKTYNILKSTESFFTKINLHIIQCDADIQEDVKITCQGDFDKYLKTMKVHGLGGTDFRPVFQYVDQLRKEKEFHNLKGLIYFTDGFGTFPEKKPDYHTAFVFVDDNYNNPDVPPWAIKLVLQKNEIWEGSI